MAQAAGMKPVLAGIAYWAMVFALGFVLGTLRVLWLAPALGLVTATLIELPVMLAASWWAARWLLRRFAIRTEGAALVMGALAFVLLMAAELVLGVTAFGQTPAQWLAGLAEPQGALGLTGQVVFALMPWIAVRRRGATSS